MRRDTIEFEFVSEHMEKYEDILTDLLKQWLVDENGLDVLISSFVSGDYGTIIIDCYFDEKHRSNALQLTEELFKKLHIESYKLVE